MDKANKKSETENRKEFEDIRHELKETKKDLKETITAKVVENIKPKIHQVGR